MKGTHNKDHEQTEKTTIGIQQLWEVEEKVKKHTLQHCNLTSVQFLMEDMEREEPQVPF